MKSRLVSPLNFFLASKEFWSYNVAGWTIAGIYLYFSGSLNLFQAGESFLLLIILLFIITGSLLGAVLRYVISKLNIIKSSLFVFTYKVTLLSFLFGGLLACALATVRYFYISGVFGNYVPSNQDIISGTSYFYKTLPWFSLCFVMWSLIYEISMSQRDKVLSERKRLDLEKNMKAVQLNALAGKTDPHFIFNALNNIRALIRVDGEKARDAILILSEMLRSPIAQATQDKIYISEEMKLVRNYIALSSIQLGNRLEYIETVADDIKTALIPSMMLQIIVENAIKHGISPLVKGGVLLLHIHSVENTIRCRITNTGKLSNQSATRGFGVGIKNIQDRLALLYNNQAHFALYEEQDIVVAELVLPLEYLP